MRQASLLLLLLLCAAAPKEQNAQVERVLDPLPNLQSAEQLYQNANFAQSILILDKLLRTAITDEVRKQAKFFLGLNFLAVGNEARATQAFQDLLDLDPEFTLPTFSSPSVRAFFNKIKASYKIIPTIDHLPPPKVVATQGAVFNVTLKRMRKGYQPKLFFRTQGQPYFSHIDLVPVSATRYQAQLPPAMLLVKDTGYSLEYFIVVSEGNDLPMAQLRNPRSPFSVAVDVPVNLDNKPVYKRWYFWVGLGGALAVAGGATAAILLTRQQAPQFGNADVAFRF